MFDTLPSFKGLIRSDSLRITSFSITRSQLMSNPSMELIIPSYSQISPILKGKDREYVHWKVGILGLSQNSAYNRNGAKESKDRLSGF